MTNHYEKIRKALAHEIWAAAQLAPGEGIVDGVARIASLLRKAAYPVIIQCAAPQRPAARPPKPTECMNGCPDRQVCDHCQWPPGPDQRPAAVDEAMVERFLEAFQNTPGDEALLRQALEALEYCRSGEDCHPTLTSEAIDALKERLK